MQDHPQQVVLCNQRGEKIAEGDIPLCCCTIYAILEREKHFYTFHAFVEGQMIFKEVIAPHIITEW